MLDCIYNIPTVAWVKLLSLCQCQFSVNSDTKRVLLLSPRDIRITTILSSCYYFVIDTMLTIIQPARKYIVIVDLWDQCELLRQSKKT